MDQKACCTCKTVKPLLDHIIPLRGECVSGLHYYKNWQLLPARQNLIKRNKLEKEYINVSI